MCLQPVAAGARLGHPGNGWRLHTQFHSLQRQWTMAGVGTGHPKLSCILFVCCLQAKENAVQSGRALPEVWLMVLHPASDHEWSMCDQPNFMQCLETAKF